MLVLFKCYYIFLTCIYIIKIIILKEKLKMNRINERLRKIAFLNKKANSNIYDEVKDYIIQNWEEDMHWHDNNYYIILDELDMISDCDGNSYVDCDLKKYFEDNIVKISKKSKLFHLISCIINQKFLPLPLKYKNIINNSQKIWIKRNSTHCCCNGCAVQKLTTRCAGRMQQKDRCASFVTCSALIF